MSKVFAALLLPLCVGLPLSALTQDRCDVLADRCNDTAAQTYDRCADRCSSLSSDSAFEMCFDRCDVADERAHQMCDVEFDKCLDELDAEAEAAEAEEETAAAPLDERSRAGSAVPAANAAAQDFCSDVNALVADGHAGFPQVKSNRLLPAGASYCDVDDPESYSLGAIHCHWKYGRFTESAELEQSMQAMVKSMFVCLTPSFSDSQMPDAQHFRGKSRSTRQLVDVLAYSNSDKSVTLNLIILKPDM